MAGFNAPIVGWKRMPSPPAPVRGALSCLEEIPYWPIGLPIFTLTLASIRQTLGYFDGRMTCQSSIQDNSTPEKEPTRQELEKQQIQ
jgi:hypothetical protein